MNIMRRALAPLLTLATSIALAYTLFGLGFVACTTPQATAAIGGTFSGWENSVFPEEDMAAIAEATRAFSIEGAPIDELSDAIRSALEDSNPQLAEAFAASGLDIAANQDKAASVAGALSDRYTLPQNALSHLQDCTPIFTTGRISVGVVGGIRPRRTYSAGFPGRAQGGRSCNAARRSPGRRNAVGSSRMGDHRFRWPLHLDASDAVFAGKLDIQRELAFDPAVP